MKFDLLKEKINDGDANILSIRTDINSMNGVVTNNIKSEIDSLKKSVQDIEKGMAELKQLLLSKQEKEDEKKDN